MKLILDKAALEDIKASIEEYLKTNCRYLSKAIKDSRGNYNEFILEADSDNKVNTPCIVTLKLVQPNSDDEEIEQQYQDDISDLKEPKRYEE